MKSTPRCPVSFSLVGKLTAHYTIVTFLILLVGCVLMYWGLIGSFTRRNVKYLNSHVQEIVGMVQKGETSAIRREVLYVDPTSSYIRHYERILDEKGLVLLETPAMGNAIPPALFTAACRDDKIVRQLINGNLYIMRSACIDVAPGKRWLLQVALEISQVEKIRKDYRDQLITVLFVGVLLCAGAGAYIASRDLSPLREIAETARRINVSNLDERICDASLPKELQDLATAFDGMLDRLKSSFESLSTYSANLAHELRTPISVLMGEAEVALSRQRSAEEYRQVLVSSLEECQRLTRLIESLLFLSRFDRNEIELKPEEVNVCQVVEDVWEYYAPLVEEHNIAIDCQGDAILLGDRALLRRAIGNLLHNAIVYNREGGKVTVTIHQAEDCSVEIRISDTGHGILPENLPKIFDRLHHDTRSKPLSPMWPGLVLPIAKAIMEVHGGTITVASEVDRGTTFILRFPPSLKLASRKMTKS